MSSAELVLLDDTGTVVEVRGPLHDCQVRDDDTIVWRGGMLSTTRPYLLAPPGTHVVGDTVDPGGWDPADYGCLVTTRAAIQDMAAEVADYAQVKADLARVRSDHAALDARVRVLEATTRAPGT